MKRTTTVITAMKILNEVKKREACKYCTVLMQLHFIVLFLNISAMYWTIKKVILYTNDRRDYRLCSKGEMQNLRKKNKMPSSIKMKKYSHGE